MLEDRLYTAGNIKPNLFNAVQSLSDSDTKALEDVKQRVLKEVRYVSLFFGGSMSNKFAS